MRELFGETQVFFCEFAQQIQDNAAVAGAGGRTRVHDAVYVKKHDGNGRFGGNAYVHDGAGRAGISRGKRLPRRRFRNNVPVAPDVFLYNQNRSGKDESDRFGGIAGAKEKRVFGVAFRFYVKTGEHRDKIFFGNPRKEDGRTKNG